MCCSWRQLNNPHDHLSISLQCEIDKYAKKACKTLLILRTPSEKGVSAFLIHSLQRSCSLWERIWGILLLLLWKEVGNTMESITPFTCDIKNDETAWERQDTKPHTLRGKVFGVLLFYNRPVQCIIQPAPKWRDIYEFIISSQLQIFLLCSLLL